MARDFKYITPYYKESIFTIFFDVSMLIYFCGFLIFNNELIDLTGMDSLIRNGSSLLLLLFGGLLFFKRKHQVDIFKNKFFVGYLYFSLFCFSSVLWAYDTTYVYAIYAPCLRIIILIFLLSVRINSLQDVHVFCVLYIISVFLLCIFVGLMMITVYSTDFIHYRFGSAFDYNPNSVSLLCVCSVSFLVYFLSVSNKLMKLTEVLVIVFFVGVVVLTLSRKGLVGIVVAPLFYILKNKRSIFSLVFISILFFFIVLMALPEEIFSDLKESVLYRFTSLSGHEKDTSTELREGYTNLAINIWLQSPLIGVGINNFAVLNTLSQGSYSHNNYAELLAGVGIVGFLLYYYPLYRLVKKKCNNSIQRMLRIVVIVMLFLEVGGVTYSSFSIQIVYALFAICQYKKIEPFNK